MAEMGENVSEMGTPVHDHRLHGLVSPLGRLILTGSHAFGAGIGRGRRLRVYGSYAAVVVTARTGRYRDTGGVACELEPGDVIFVFPEQAHWYGPRAGRTWDERYVTFDGPVFDLWRTAGLLDPSRPVRRMAERGLAWAERLERWVASMPADPAWAIVQLLELLREPLQESSAPGAVDRRGDSAADDAWLARARSVLETNLAAPLEARTLAAEVGLPYESFRKRFQQATGVSPIRYRTERRIEAARQLLRFSPNLTNRQVAEALGFADEYHFSRRFSSLTGASPRDARRRQM